MPAQKDKLLEHAQRVLLVTEYFPPHWTGLSQTFYYLARHLADRGHNVAVLTTQFDHATPAYEEDSGLSITRVPYQFILSRTHYSYKIIGTFINMLPQCETVIVNSPNSNILFYALLTKLFRKKLHIYHQADILLPRQTGSILKHLMIEKVFDICTIPSVLLADQIGLCTRDYATFSRVMRYGLDKFHAYIPDVTLSLQQPHPDFKKKLDILKKTYTLIGISGRFVEEKGFDILFQALPEILARIPDVHIVFAGKKIIDYEPFYERHRALFEKHAQNITFLGLLQGGNYTYFFDCLDLFVLSSRIDCFPVTQLEAAQRHVPIVVTDVAGARMLVKKTGFGEIAKREDPHDLAEKIVTVLQNKAHYLQNYKNVRPFLEKFHKYHLKIV